MKRETKSILDYLKAIAWVVVPFCLLGSLHYLFIFFPRTVCEEDNHILFNHLGFDYFGVIVGFFTLLVTFLIGWNIYSTINAKEELERTKETLTQKYKTDIATMKSDIEKLKGQMAAIENQSGSNEKTSKPVTFEIPKYMKDWVDYDILKRGTPLYNWLWNFLGEKTSADEALAEYERIKAKTPKRVAFIDGREASKTELIALIKEMLPIKLDAIKYKDL